ncbi:MAG: hypothetical protein PHS92_02475 [Candidatus Gracilibacteria bacterium]|nr:hypothetical protein [Candidatus Gracilibacteria bacterium]
MNLEETRATNEELLGPPKADMLMVGLNAVGSLIAGFAGGLIILVSVYFFLGKTQAFSGVYPYIFSLTGFFAVLFTSGLNLIMNRLLNPDKYKRGMITFVQVFIFSTFLYIFLAPGYLYTSYNNQAMLIYIFTIHILVGILGTSIFSEVLSNYRYILLGLYGSFIGFFVSILISILIFLNLTKSNQSLYILIGTIIIINLTINTCRSLFEYVYYIIYKNTDFDQLGDIFYQIEQEEKEIAENARKKLERFE